MRLVTPALVTHAKRVALLSGVSHPDFNPLTLFSLRRE